MKSNILGLVTTNSTVTRSRSYLNVFTNFLNSLNTGELAMSHNGLKLAKFDDSMLIAWRFLENLGTGRNKLGKFRIFMMIPWRIRQV